MNVSEAVVFDLLVQPCTEQGYLCVFSEVRDLVRMPPEQIEVFVDRISVLPALASDKVIQVIFRFMPDFPVNVSNDPLKEPGPAGA